MNKEFAAKLALACNIVAAEGHSDISLGHLTARLPGEDRIYMKPSGLGLEEITADDIIVIDLDGNKLEGERKRHGEYPIHTEVYRRRPEVNCVVHTHPPYATALGASGATLRPVSHEGVLFAEAPVFRDTTALILDPPQGRAVAECLGQHNALLMQNHGVVVVGTSIEQATVYAVLLEKAARAQFLTSGFGKMIWTTDEEVPFKVEQIYRPDNIHTFFEYYARKLQRSRQ